MTQFIKNIFIGFGSAMDLLPSRRSIRKISYLSQNKDLSASDAFRKDWEMIGKDFSRAIEIEKTRIGTEK
jgi:hypothetical protein